MSLTEFNNEIRLEWRVEGSLNKITLTISFRNHIKLLAVTQNLSREESLVFNLKGLSYTKDANQPQIYAIENLMLGSRLVEIGEWLNKYLVSGISDLDTLAQMYVSKILFSENYDKIEKIHDSDMKITVKSDSLSWTGTDHAWENACFLASHHLLDRQ